MVDQESDLGHCLHNKCQITAKYTFIDISTDSFYVALNASNATFNEHLKCYKNKQPKKYTKNLTKYRKTPILHQLGANSHTCWSDSITFVGSISSLEVTLTACHNLGLLKFSLAKMGGVHKISVPIFKSFQFRTLLSFTEIQVFFSFKCDFLLFYGLFS